MNFLQKLERKFGKYAIRGLTKYIIMTYVIGYILVAVNNISGTGFMTWLTLNPGAIMQGQVWRLVSWVLMPPSSFGIFTIIMLICYYQLGTILERVWGDFMYNFYIFFGLIMTVIGAFVMYFVLAYGSPEMSAMMGSELGGQLGYQIGSAIGAMFNTYYVSLSIFLGFAMTFPDQQMLLFFFIPIKIKWLALVDVAYLSYNMIRAGMSGNWITIVQIICSLAAVILFFLMTRKYSFRNAYSSSQSRKRRNEFKKAMGAGQARNASGARHKCSICGRTEITNPELEFRYCSKCNGNYEYCQEHLFTHTHVK